MPTILAIAKEILEGPGRKGMHVNDIANAAVAQNKNMGLSAEALSKKIMSALAANLKLKNSKPTFAKVLWGKGPRKGKPKQGWYKLRPTRTPPPPPPPTPPREVPPIFFGKAGEYAVMSELFFGGYNASVMTVDDGIDLVANKNSKFFYIQVKTASSQRKWRSLFLKRLEQIHFEKVYLRCKDLSPNSCHEMLVGELCSPSSQHFKVKLL